MNFLLRVIYYFLPKEVEVCYGHGYIISFMDVCLGYEGKNNSHSVGFQYVYACVSVHNRGKNREKKIICKGWKMPKLDRGKCQLLVLWWGESLKSCSSVEGLPVFCMRL